MISSNLYDLWPLLCRFWRVSTIDSSALPSTHGAGGASGGFGASPVHGAKLTARCLSPPVVAALHGLALTSATSQGTSSALRRRQSNAPQAGCLRAAASVAARAPSSLRLASLTLSQPHISPARDTSCVLLSGFLWAFADSLWRRGNS